MKSYSLQRGFVEVAADEALNGCYVAWLVSRSSAALMADWMRFVGVPEPVAPEDLHCTVMYSPERSLTPGAHGDRPLPMPHTVPFSNRSTQILGARDDKPGALVVVFPSAQVEARNTYYRDVHGLEHSFPTVLPHVTLSYNAAACPRDLFCRLVSSPMPLPIELDRERVTWLNA
jgi:hypothetical protein